MKNLITAIALILVLCLGVYAVVYMQQEIPITYDGRDPDGVADIIVKENLEKTQAVNNVTAIVFDFRGYDTLGESFVLLIAITGATVILRRARNRWEGGK